MSQSPNLQLTSKIVAAYVSHNPLPATELPNLMNMVSSALLALESPAAAAAPLIEPNVPIRKSVTPDYIICLDDGKKFKSLKRHLGLLGMTPAQYREKWNLPDDYPMVASNYAVARSALAKRLGLGRKPGQKAAPRKPAK